MSAPVKKRAMFAKNSGDESDSFEDGSGKEDNEQYAGQQVNKGFKILDMCSLFNTPSYGYL